MSEISELIFRTLSTPTGGFVTFLQFLLGIALGYVFVKALKYILAFIGILLLGSALSAWSLGTLPEDIMSRLGVSLETLRKLLVWFTAILVGPVAAGFIIGAIIALIKK